MFPLKFGNEITLVTKIKAHEFTAFHQETIAQTRYENRTLIFPNKDWKSTFLGAGEEKAVFCVCDQENHVFALELIDQRTYLNGRFIGGAYFYERIIPGLGNIKFNPKSVIGLTFTGLVKAREFVYGYEWARFQFSPIKFSWLDLSLTSYLQVLFGSGFAK